MFAFLCSFLLLLTPVSWLENSFQPYGLLGYVNSPVQVAQIPSSQQPNSSQQQVLERLFTTSEAEADWFVPSFLEQILLPQVQMVLTDISNRLGEFQGVEETADGFEVQFSGGTVPAQIRLTADGKIAGLFFEPPAIPIRIEEAIALLESSPYDTSLIITRDDETLAELNADSPLAVGSTFKLAVLAALKQQIDAGALSWDTVVTLQPEQKSLPSGIIQDWPDGSFITVDTLATLMISVSDNTATDLLMQTVGREAIEALTEVMDERNQPFLTTRETFILKNPENAWLLRRYRNADTEARRRVLEELGDRPLPSVNAFTGEPVAIDVEWFFSSRQLCSLMDSVAQLPAMQVNPGVANPRNWEHIAFKGGSEPGVLNLTTHLTNEAGHTYCVSATWNSAEQPLNEEMLTQLYQSIIAGLAQRED
ncbi:MAG: serine hydrolase [Leptolyngbyaceae bacterium]|nr:serine hydrolase [Leptolyngbyaceae bacterium]